MGTVLKLFSIPRDGKFFVGMPVFEMKGTNLGFGWVCPQVVGLTVFIQLIKCIRKIFFHIIKAVVLVGECDAQIVSIDES